MRSYDVHIASLAIQAPQKWTDNLLSQHRIDGVVSARRGVTRLIPHSALVRIALIRQLCVGLGMSTPDAAMLAPMLLASADGIHEHGQIRLIADRRALELQLDARLKEALEFAPRRPRGRPPTRV